ncbi:MurR/RpiR family transcriptional regulator [Leucothrix pacifica]|uniref:Fe-S cluster assembly protein HesB n=1 Tax=Leucothrix pacifica TaxID=1247513 RepID=A0A317C3Y5_9GAMM|nr:MurR/RpiR family transcriptional regulator [Leucothrix pacifica]PWQ93298.1 Fe-S cluster assembly protein HesB [Leucothrix pacifica]
MSSRPDPEHETNIEITSLKQLQGAIAENQAGLSKRLRQVAGWLLEHPNQTAFSTLAEIAESAGVHASTLVRFANFFGFNGFSELQKLYKQDLLDNTSNYQQRIQQVKEVADHSLDNRAAGLLQEFASANVLTMELLRAQVSPDAINAALDAMIEAKNIHICGFRRVYSVAHYFHYALSQLNVPSYLMTGTGGMLDEQLQWMDKSSLLIAITFHPYINLTRDAVATAHKKGAKVLLITDSELCPVADIADHLLVVREAEVRAFRSLNATFCLAQTLCVALGYQRQNNTD